MIRAILMSALLLIVLHLFAGAGFVGWLYHTDRLNRDRLERVVEMFELTIDEEQAQLADADRLARETRRQAEQIARLEAVADGPRTLQDRLATERESDEVSQQRLERLQRETDDLRRQIARAQTQITRDREELDAKRAAFEEAVERQRRLQEDDDFQQTVQMYEQLRPGQAKQMFQELMNQGKTDQVVEYLAAMQLRRASRVVSEFKEGDEVVMAAELLESLRERGVNLTSGRGGEDRS
ncbi:hypothetical protein ACERK3_10115 [Phycisphaerales bacterium AB-hyl4]|uniref:Magnesium transporter MgtE intracellular domain-containing protein n=1 Tax=Natronomicrosphaera hydrolytica TaxID=3242702 RepID=A0ABV4U4X4_9BACT